MKRVGLIKVLRTNSVFLVVFLLVRRKKQKKALKLSKIHHWNDRVKTGTCEKLNEALLVTAFQSMLLFFWRKLMHLLRPSITTILQHRIMVARTYALLYPLCNTVHREETSPAYFFENLAEIIWTAIIRKLM